MTAAAAAASPTPPIPPTPPTAAPHRRKRALRLLTLLLLGLGVGWALWWGLVSRHHVETDDAYVAGDVVHITPQISGTVTFLAADDTERVQAGAVLVKLDAADAQLAYQRAETELAQAAQEHRHLVATTQQLAAALAVRQAELARAENDLQRREALASTDAIAKEELLHARAALGVARAASKAAAAQWQANLALLGEGTLTTHPAVARAAARLREAHLALSRVTIPAPVSGYVAKRSVQVGQRVNAGAPLMAVVPLDSLWVDANFKEVQLAPLRIGQPVALTADVYGSSVHYHGKVVGLGAGTGGASSLLPPQNASGNWVKVAQRVPVRIALDPKELAAQPLRVGLSMTAVVDTTDQSGEQLARTARTAPPVSTAVFAPAAEAALEARIQALLAAPRGAAH